MDTLSLLRTGQLTGCRRLDLSCGLTQFPAEIFDLAESLEILNLSGNALSSLPDDLGRLHKLRILFCSDNQFTELPAVLGQCRQLEMVGFKANRIHRVPAAALTPALRWLILTDNRISELPAELGQCTRLQKLMLAGNQLQHLPLQMAACTALELLRIAANRFSALPDWLLALPRLSWLAYAGNPFCEVSETAALAQRGAKLRSIAWHGLDLQQQLGEGASGVIYQASWHSDAGRKEVAVKLFKGALTSDGLPHSEMAACISAGAHPNLIGVDGKVDAHPAGTAGLVMALIDASFRNLAGPPSLASCTRDMYAADASFTLATALRIAHGIAAAACHLHAQGILHGDLYAHNILHNGQGDCLLGDFGAASFFAPEDPARAQALQRIEVRAFACLLEELLERCVAAGGAQDTLETLWTLQARCARNNSAERPLFAEIEQNIGVLLTALSPDSATTE
ncbi:MAG: protein kinase [Nitrosomonadales bacterium]|nr:protein kinase [Nitrosomonadales bacterium]